MIAGVILRLRYPDACGHPDLECYKMTHAPDLRIACNFSVVVDPIGNDPATHRGDRFDHSLFCNFRTSIAKIDGHGWDQRARGGKVNSADNVTRLQRGLYRRVIFASLLDRAGGANSQRGRDPRRASLSRFTVDRPMRVCNFPGPLRSVLRIVARVSFDFHPNLARPISLRHGVNFEHLFDPDVCCHFRTGGRPGERGPGGATLAVVRKFGRKGVCNFALLGHVCLLLGGTGLFVFVHTKSVLPVEITTDIGKM